MDTTNIIKLCDAHLTRRCQTWLEEGAIFIVVVNDCVDCNLEEDALLDGNKEELQ